MPSCRLYQSWTDPSARVLTGRYLRSYGKRAAAFSSNSTPTGPRAARRRRRPARGPRRRASQRGGGVLPDEAEGLLVLGRGRVLDPEHPEGFEVLAQVRGLDRGQPVVDVVQEVEVVAELLPYGGHVLGHPVQVLAGVPALLRGQLSVGRLVGVPLTLAHAVDLGDSGHGGLGAEAAVAEPGDVVEELGDVVAAGMAVDGDPVAGGAAEELVDGESGDLALDAPQGHVDRGDGGHGDRTAPPVGALVEVLPNPLDRRRVLADEQRVILRVT